MEGNISVHARSDNRSGIFWRIGDNDYGGGKPSGE